MMKTPTERMNKPKASTTTSTTSGSSSKLRLTVVIPIYNAAEYVANSIDSVLGQTIKFKDNCEIILVDDGSTDNSREVCKTYTDRYPENIKYIYQENAGVSRARNAGIDLARGEYVHFLDSDDLISKDYYKRSIAFLKNNPGVDVVASKIQFFDSIIDSHPLNGKFHKERVINLNDETRSVLLHMPTCVLRTSAIKGRRFDERLQITEDSVFLNTILADKKSYGVLVSPTYYYRKRKGDNSAIDGKLHNKSYYIDTPEYAYKAMMDAWTDNGRIHPYMQHLLLYDISYRLQQDSQSVLDSAEERRYKENILATIKRFDTAVILSSNSYDLHGKLYLLKVKLGSKMSVDRRDDGYYFDGVNITTDRSPYVHVDFIHELEDSIQIEGYLEGINDVRDVQLNTGGSIVNLEPTERKQREVSFLGDTIFNGAAFRVTYPTGMSPNLTLNFSMTGGAKLLPISTGVYTGLGGIRGAYSQMNKYIVRKARDSIALHRKTKHKIFVYEIRFLFSILVHWRLGVALEQFGKLQKRNLSQLKTRARVFELAKPALVIGETILMIPRAVLLRVCYFILKSYKKNTVWIISDRGMAAGDNGEALFRYIQSQSDTPADVYFSISKKSKDYKRLESIGRTLNQGSLRHKLYFLLADKVISSHADIETTNPFLRQKDHFIDLYTFDFIFLQHGVTKDDISSWLNRFEKNIALFVTAGKPEYDSILEYPYYYPKDRVVLSGFPRHDLLENNPKNKVIIAPTYRAGLLKTNTDATGARPYDSSFKNSAYFHFYNNLLNDSRITKALRDKGMVAELYLHPNFAAQVDDFQQTSVATVAKYPYDYKAAFSEGSLLVTDYSSVAFDFAYLRKPVIYSQFDGDTFFAGHSYSKGYFSYEQDGFGSVYNNYEATISGIIKEVNSNCRLSVRYEKRVNNFFTYNDHENSRRVYEGILSL